MKVGKKLSEFYLWLNQLIRWVALMFCLPHRRELLIEFECIA
ncbi:hypothetical protein SynBIOSU31_01490 [Synechococcus sp. BIOS-U3-1]|nr:hypothetical protein SynBIOSU31_01490 [Synechococcus sp. BIOS-U3-1]